MASLVIASGATVTLGVTETANVQASAASAYGAGSMTIQNFKATGNRMVKSKIKFSADILNASTNYGVYTSAYITITKGGKTYAQLDYNLNKNEDTWIPTEAGQYTATLSVVDWYGQYAAASLTLDIAKDDGNIRIENFTATPAYGAITTTSSVKFDADFINASTNYGVYTSAYIEIKKDGVTHATLDFNNGSRQDKWTPTEEGTYSTASAAIKPSTAGTYQVRMKVKDANGTVVSKTSTLTVKNALQNTSAISATKVKTGKSVTVTCAAKGGTGSYTYAVYYKKSTDSNWTTAQGYKANSTVSVKLSAAATYNVLVKVKDSNGAVTDKKFTVTATK